MHKLRIVLAQLNLLVGDITSNINKLITAANIARDKHQADVIVFSELAVTGYPPEDLLFRQSFLDEVTAAINHFKNTVQGIYCVIPHPHSTAQGLFNSCSLIYNGHILGRYAKQHLPNYGVFDERRYFTEGNTHYVATIKNIPVGIVICEDLWNPGPIQQAALQGARLILSPNASPFTTYKHEARHLVLARRAKDNNLPIFYVNCVGGQDELVFDGGSMVVNPEGVICQHAGFFNENLLSVDIEVDSTTCTLPTQAFTLLNDETRIYNALVLGLRDYVEKNQFPGVIIGVSGGIDSALTLAIAVDALGKDRVQAIFMPSRYTSPVSLEDSEALTKALDLPLTIISIEPHFESFLSNLNTHLKDIPNLTKENLQARIRGVILMALSNSSGNMVLTTGNRSELAVGYATLYGDMVGGFSVLKDIPKTLVYRLAAYRNTSLAVIPENIITRAPTAELAPNQKDEDTLPPYPTLDKIIELYVNQNQSIDEIIQQGLEKDVVMKVINLIKKSEYKRRQAAVGVTINYNAFGRARRYPITSGFKG